MAVSKKHHFLPRFYLKGFTVEGTNDGRLWLFDQKLRFARPGTPNSLGYQSNYNRIDVPGLKPDQLESDFGNKVESPMAVVLGDIIASKTLPVCGPDVDIFLNFVAFSIARSPVIRNVFAEHIDSTIKRRLREELKTSSRLEVLRNIAQQAGTSTVEELIEFTESDDYTISFDQTSVVGSTLIFHEHFLNAAANRHWNLWFVDDRCPDLVCSDLAVGLFQWRLPNLCPPIYAPKDWFNDECFLILPLNRRMAAVGAIQGTPRERILNTAQVGVLNMHIGNFARQVFSSAPEYVIWQGDKLCKADASKWMKKPTPQSEFRQS
jgi:hypothetical protein